MNKLFQWSQIFCKFWDFSLEFQKFARSLEQDFLTVGQNNFGNKIPFHQKLQKGSGQQKITPLFHGRRWPPWASITSKNDDVANSRGQNQQATNLEHLIKLINWISVHFVAYLCSGVGLGVIIKVLPPWKSVKVSWVAKIGQNFYNYSGVQPSAKIFNTVLVCIIFYITMYNLLASKELLIVISKIIFRYLRSFKRIIHIINAISCQFLSYWYFYSIS